MSRENTTMRKSGSPTPAAAPTGKPLAGRHQRRRAARIAARRQRIRRAGHTGTGATRLTMWRMEANSALRVQAERLGMPWGTVQNRRSLVARLNREQAAACGVTPHDWANMTRKERETLKALAQIRNLEATA